MMNKRKLNYKRIIVAVVSLVTIIAVVVGVVSFIFRPYVEFVKNHEVEINTKVDAKAFIKDTNKCELKDIEIDASKVKNDKLGEYPITYKVNDKEYTFEVKIVDTQAPTFEASDIDIEVGAKVEAKDFVDNIKDSTKTTVSWKKDYTFDKEGTQEVTIIVEDEAGNKTEKTIQAKIVKDTEKPILTGIDDMVIVQNGRPNYEAGVTARDNRDPKPQVKIDSSQVKLSTLGTYKVTYTVTDRSGNKNTYQRTVKIVDKKSTGTIKPTGEKVVYLTFDDGPSENTKKIVDILDKYNAKATFFVTGNGQKYNKYIKEAHQKGHTIGLHTYSHNYKQLYSSVDAYFDDLTKVGNMVKEQIGFVPTYIRFPGGSSNTTSRKYCKGIMSTLVKEVQNRGYQYYDWNGDTEDATGNNVSVSRIVRAATSSKSNNIMILAHDTQAKDTTVQALPQIIEHYQKLGYTFRGIDDSSFTPHHGVNN